MLLVVIPHTTVAKSHLPHKKINF